MISSVSGYEEFLYLPAPGFAGLEVQVSRKLHRKGGATLILAPASKIYKSGLGYSQRIKACVMEEVLIFGCKQRVYQHFRHVGESNRMPPL